jgi:ABC-type Fe2+-enterobactin transport system substrate-binding protein
MEVGKEAVSVVREFENHRVNVREQITAPFRDPHEIARTQLVRFRRRLGTLTLDQELQIEDLVISTVTKVSSITGRLLESLGLELCNEPRGNNELPKC